MAKNQLTIRMYRQGLGDCFLLSFSRKPKPFHMLIDCGALNSKHYDSALMNEVVRDIKTKTKKHLDVLVVSHEHWDHVSGFVQAKTVFDEIDVDEVWVAWTEEPDNPAAQVLRDRFKKQKMAVEGLFAHMPPDGASSKSLRLSKSGLKELFDFFGGLGANGKANADLEAAWDYVLHKGRVCYCDPKKPPMTLEGVQGARVFVLGPPEDPEFVKKRTSTRETYQNPISFALFESFLAAVMPGDSEDKERALPFDKRYRIEPSEAKKDKFFAEHYGFGFSPDREWRQIDYDWLNLAEELALHLDNYTNNTSLALAIELGDDKKVLLFPGDAQVGNWLSWGELAWDVPDGTGRTRTVKAEDLLARTVVYKVGHHGSHNATLRAKGLEKMDSAELVALIPVHRETAQDQAWEFPYPALWDNLKKRARGRVLLADARGIGEISAEDRKMLSPAEWSRFKAATKYQKLFVEYRISY